MDEKVSASSTDRKFTMPRENREDEIFRLMLKQHEYAGLQTKVGVGMLVITSLALIVTTFALAYAIFNPPQTNLKVEVIPAASATVNASLSP